MTWTLGEVIKRSLVGMKPYWWESPSWDVKHVFINPSYKASWGLSCVAVSGEIGTQNHSAPKIGA